MTNEFVQTTLANYKSIKDKAYNIVSRIAVNSGNHGLICCYEVGVTTDLIHAHLGPSTHGIGKWISLPISLLAETEEVISREIERVAQELSELDKPCSKCGQVKREVFQTIRF